MGFHLFRLNEDLLSLSVPVPLRQDPRIELEPTLVRVGGFSFILSEVVVRISSEPVADHASHLGVERGVSLHLLKLLHEVLFHFLTEGLVLE